MMSATALRAVPRALQSTPYRATTNSHILKASLRTLPKAIKHSSVLSLALRQPKKTGLVRYATGGALPSRTFAKSRDNEAETRWSMEKLAPLGVEVSESSSIHPAVSGEVGQGEPEPEPEMMGGVKSDFATIVETFSLKDVPREALYVGLAGVIPYLATSLSTVYLSFDIQYAAMHGQGIILSGETAENLLHIIEPIQLGYGASIISFLGAIHWGLEWAGFGGYQGYPRYAIGIVATAVAWPTLLLPAEVGLVTQFLAFTFLYYADSRASTRGWAPSWYSTYRFVLTFIVGASIVASLIGRGQIADLITRPPGPADRMRALRRTQLQDLEDTDAESKARAANIAEGADEDEEQGAAITDEDDDE